MKHLELEEKINRNYNLKKERSFLYNPTTFTLVNGTDAVLDEVWSYQVVNKFKNHYRAATAPSDVQPGMIYSDSDDEKLYHEGASAAEEVLQRLRSQDCTVRFTKLGLGKDAVKPLDLQTTDQDLAHLSSSHATWAGFYVRALTSGAKPFVQLINTADSKSAYHYLDPANDEWKFYYGADRVGITSEGLVWFGGYAVRVYRMANQSIPNNVDTAINYDNERFDADDMHDNATNNTRLVAKKDGKYLIGATAEWAGNSGGTYRRMDIRKNGSAGASDREENVPDGTNEIPQRITTLLDLSANDYVEQVMRQDSGGALNVLVGNGVLEFWMAKIG